MSPRSGKVMALFPPHTTDMMSFFSFFFFFCAGGCMSCHLGVCRVIIDGPPRWCADRTLERRSVLLSRSLFDCQHISPVLSPPRLSLFLSVRKVSILPIQCTPPMMITHFWRRKKLNPFLNPPLHYGSVVTDRDVVEGKIIQTQLPNL